MAFSIHLWNDHASHCLSHADSDLQGWVWLKCFTCGKRAVEEQHIKLTKQHWIKRILKKCKDMQSKHIVRVNVMNKTTEARHSQWISQGHLGPWRPVSNKKASPDLSSTAATAEFGANLASRTARIARQLFTKPPPWELLKLLGSWCRWVPW